MLQKLQEVFAGEVGQEALRVLDQVRELMTHRASKFWKSKVRAGSGPATVRLPIPRWRLNS